MPMIKNNVVEQGRTPEASVKMADIIDEAAKEFIKGAETKACPANIEKNKQETGNDQVVK